MIVALIPAHNEAAEIKNTIKSLQAQTVVPDRIVVASDNSTDDTVKVSRAVGAEVFETMGNRHKKAGALNQALDYLLPDLNDQDYLVIMDADSILDESWIANATARYRPYMGAVSGAYVARKGKGVISYLQRAEYAQERRRIARRQGHVDVLSGTAVLIPVRVLRELIAVRGVIYDVDSLTEDFEITLALKEMNYKPRCFKELRVVTDVMETWTDLYRQRLRWQRGTIETLRKYGWTRSTRKTWINQIIAYSMSLAIVLIVAAWTTAFAMGIGLSPLWLAAMPIFMVEQVVSSWRGGLGARVLALTLLPMWVYDVFRTFVYWSALIKSVRNSEKVWVT